jgi:radical SAM protein with 4Fe4S-binding SPASM domain
MTYFVKKPYFSYLINYFNNSNNFRNSRILTLNKSAKIEIEKYVNTKIKTKFIKNLENRKINIKNLKIIGSEKKLSPLHIQIEITDNCNLNCSYCYRNSKFCSSHSNEMDFDKFKDCINKFKKTNLLEIGITGGEPTLNKDFIKIMKYALKELENVELITNGTNYKIIKELIKITPKNDLNKLNISVSLHNWTEKINEIKSGKHYINKFILELRKLRPLRIILTDINFNSIKSKEIEKLLKKLNVKKVDYSFISPIGRAKDKVNEEEYILKSNKINRNKKPSLNKLNCSLILKHSCISPSGNIRPCALFPISFKIGNTKMGIFKNYNKFFNMPCPNKEVCEDCNLLNYCIGCIYKGLYNSNKNCKYRKLIKEKFLNISNDILSE